MEMETWETGPFILHKWAEGGGKLLRDFALRPSEEEKLRSFAESLLQHGF